MSKPVIGLALGSGAARGWSHIGILEVLVEEGLEPDVIAGCSMGAFVGAAFLTGSLQRLKDWAEALSFSGFARRLDISPSSGGIIAGKLIERLMDELGIKGDIKALPKPFATVATDYLTGREVWHQTGPVGEAVRASISVPGVIAPYRIGSDWFVDGGLVNPVPVSVCRALGASVIIAVNLNGDLVGRRGRSDTVPPNEGSRNEMIQRAIAGLPTAWRENTTKALQDVFSPKPHTPPLFDVLANSINIMQDRITRSRMAGEPPHVMIMPQLLGMGPFQFDQAKKAIEEGRARARLALPHIEHALATSAEGVA